jgi:hypothetical protein
MNAIKKALWQGGLKMLKFTTGILIGAILIVALPIIIALFFDTDIQWETLVTGLLAFAGAGLTVLTIKEQIKIQQYQLQNERFQKLHSIKTSLRTPTLEYQTYIHQIFLQKNGFVSILDESNDRENFIQSLNNVEYVDWKLNMFINSLKFYDKAIHIQLEVVGENFEEYKAIIIPQIVILKVFLEKLNDFLNTNPLENNLPKVISSEYLVNKFEDDFLYKSMDNDDATKNKVIEKLKEPIIIWTDNDERIFFKE